jgi:type IX secretion system substrate protein
MPRSAGNVFRTMGIVFPNHRIVFRSVRNVFLTVGTVARNNLLGNTVKQLAINSNQLLINVADLNEGVYNISLQSNEGVVNKRLVIVR